METRRRRDTAKRLQVQPQNHLDRNKYFPDDTITWLLVSEIKMKLLHALFEEQIERYCLAEFGGPGL